MRTLTALIAVIALAGCPKKKETPATAEPAGSGSGSTMASGSAMGSADTGSGSAMGAGSAMGSGSATGSGTLLPPVVLADGFSFKPVDAAFAVADDDAPNPTAWDAAGKPVQVGLGFGAVDKKKFPVQIVVIDNGKLDVKKTLSAPAIGEVGTFTLAPFGKDKFYVEVNLSSSDAAGTHDLLGAVLAADAKGITVEQSGTWQEIGDDLKKTPKWAADARTIIAAQ